MLVGDILISVRELVSDLPRGLSIPGTPAPTITVVASIGSTLPTGDYYLRLAWANRWGQVLSPTEFGPFTVGVDQGIQLAGIGIAFVPGATQVNIYFGLGPAGEGQMLSTSTFAYVINQPGTPASLPNRNTSFYPDADGQRMSAFTLYRWLNEGLEEASKVCGGIPDMSGFPTENTQALYQLQGLWPKIDHLWFDGYICSVGGRDSLFYRNVVPGFSGVAVLQQAADKMIVELQPQPNRSGAATALAAPLSSTATTITVSSTADFKLPFGIAWIGDPTGATFEIVAYSAISGATLTGCQRGLGGTVPTSFSGSETVREANVRFTGLRNFTNPTYFVGMSAATLPTPSGWRAPLIDYLVSKFREAQGNTQEAQRKMTSFNAFLQATARGNRQMMGPRQVGAPGSGSLDTYPSAGLGGRIIVP